MPGMPPRPRRNPSPLVGHLFHCSRAFVVTALLISSTLISRLRNIWAGNPSFSAKSSRSRSSTSTRTSPEPRILACARRMMSLHRGVYGTGQFTFSCALTPLAASISFRNEGKDKPARFSAAAACPEFSFNKAAKRCSAPTALWFSESAAWVASSRSCWADGENDLCHSVLRTFQSATNDSAQSNQSFWVSFTRFHLSCPTTGLTGASPMNVYSSAVGVAGLGEQHPPKRKTAASAGVRRMSFMVSLTNDRCGHIDCDQTTWARRRWVEEPPLRREQERAQ